MLPRYKTEELRKQAETIYMLRQQGKSLADIARRMETAYPNVAQRYRRECLLREQAFYYPFIEYITARTEKAIRRSLGEDTLAEPENLNGPETLRTLLKWPGVNDGVLNDLAEGLAEAGYGSFDPETIKESLYKKIEDFRTLRQ